MIERWIEREGRSGERRKIGILYIFVGEVLVVEYCVIINIGKMCGWWKGGS